MEKVQDNGVSILVSSSHDSDHDQELDHPDESPVGSPDADKVHILPPLDQKQATVLSDDLRVKIIKQVEYYFSDINLPNDKFLMKYVSRNVDGYVPIGVIASFRKMKKLTKDVSLIVAALKESQHVVMSSNGKKVKRLHPLPMAEARDPMVCTVLVENLPADHSLENLRRLFGEAGSARNISVCEPHDVKEPQKCSVAEKLITGKPHALVEYDTVEAAAKAVVSLNNGQDWRHGLRAKLLKKVNKSEQKKKTTRRESESDKCGIVHTSMPSGNEEKHNSSEKHESHDEETVDRLSKEKIGKSLKEKDGNKVLNHGKGRRQKHHGHGGHGHGTHSSIRGIEPSKPPPGPKMPDGTRGFTMGRGRPPITG